MSNDSTLDIVEILPPLVLETAKSTLAISMAFHAVSLSMSDGSSTMCHGDTSDISVAVVAKLEATTVDSSWLKVVVTMFRSFVAMVAMPIFAAPVPSTRRQWFAHPCHQDAIQA
jgi:hypothetical protein